MECTAKLSTRDFGSCQLVAKGPAHISIPVQQAHWTLARVGGSSDARMDRQTQRVEGNRLHCLVGVRVVQEPAQGGSQLPY